MRLSVWVGLALGGAVAAAFTAPYGAAALLATAPAKPVVLAPMPTSSQFVIRALKGDKLGANWVAEHDEPPPAPLEMVKNARFQPSR